MQTFINCIADHSSEGKLLIGNTQTALIDCGMIFCADATIKKVKDALDGRSLDYILFSHTHYDHIGALPFFRQAFPQVKGVTTEVGATVLLKDTPRRVIRELSQIAAQNHGVMVGDYSDDAFCADVIVKDGDCIDLGGLTVQIIETPGHTRDSLSFFVPELGILCLNETTGVLLPDGNVYVCYLTGYQDAINAIERCRKLPYKHLSLPHRGIVDGAEAENYFDKALQAYMDCRAFILDMYVQGLDEEAMLDGFFLKYADEMLLQFQPKAAFYANAKATIACTLKEANP
ncbi:MAG: MBL fold metallo-hydrolase [Oscillospiraceae bacterium]|nr:MBL fold metallo-hydrolase [Oscillospiraceae bacterium]